MCALAWQRDGRVRWRTQTSVAASADGAAWVVFDASPDLREQIRATPALQPRALRDSPISDVVVTGAEIDRVAGLLHLREGHRFTLHATAAVHAALDRNPIFAALPPERVTRAVLPLGSAVSIAGLTVTAWDAPGKSPLWAEGEHPNPGTNVGLLVTHDSRAVVYLPGVADIDAAWRERMRGAPVVLHDATVWTDDELIRLGLSHKTGRRMGHAPLSGDGGSLAQLGALGIGRLILLHINNSNPILIDGSPEALAVRAAGAEIGFDGMEIWP